jgi:7-cyano-7-deazaguanine synthase
MKTKAKAVVIFSGGQDSTTCLFWARERYETIEAITFVYGQKHLTEVECSKRICEKYGIKQNIVDISFLSAINDSAMVHGEDTSKMKNDLPTSFVPNRNQLFITLAHMYAQKIGALYLVTGVCQTDYSGYPDCRQIYITAIEMATNLGSNAQIQIHAPLMYLTKAETFELAEALDVLYEVCEMSHTCYEGNRSLYHGWGYGCGECPACQLRAKGWKEFTNKRSGNVPVTS